MTESQIEESQLPGECAPQARSQTGSFNPALETVLVEDAKRPALYVAIREPEGKSRAPAASVEIVIPVFNQLAYTQGCLESLRRSAGVAARIVVVNNGSSDGTAEYLDADSGVDVIHNSENRGCAAAWNQGVRAGTADWVVVLNNDVLLTPGWLEGLLMSAEAEGLDVVTPAMREGLLNYELEPYAREFVKAAAGAIRPDVADGVCFMVRRRVFEVIGLFDENFRIGVFEDTDFFERARQAGFKLGTTGRSFIHHFGSVTQKSIRQSKTCGPYEEENRVYFRRKWQLNQIQRWINRFKRKAHAARWSAVERRKFGHTLRECWRRGRLVIFKGGKRGGSGTGVKGAVLPDRLPEIYRRCAALDTHRALDKNPFAGGAGGLSGFQRHGGSAGKKSPCAASPHVGARFQRAANIAQALASL